MLSYLGISFEEHGWYILAFAIICYYLYCKALPYIQDYQKYKDEKEYAAKYHKNPDLLAARLSAQEARTQQLQQKYNETLEEFKKRQEEREAKKREQVLQNTEAQLGGHVLGGSSKKTLRPDYNPLMGSGSGNNYRPQRKSPCSGGGCGR